MPISSPPARHHVRCACDTSLSPRPGGRFAGLFGHAQAAALIRRKSRRPLHYGRRFHIAEDIGHALKSLTYAVQPRNGGREISLAIHAPQTGRDYRRVLPPLGYKSIASDQMAGPGFIITHAAIASIASLRLII